MKQTLELQELPAHPGSFQVKSLPWLIVSDSQGQGFQVTCFSRQVLRPDSPQWLQAIYPPLKTRRPHTVTLFEGQSFKSPQEALERLQAEATWQVRPARRPTGRV